MSEMPQPTPCMSKAGKSQNKKAYVVIYAHDYAQDEGAIKILIARNNNHYQKQTRGYGSFPGGTVNPWESSEAGLRREYKEETGLELCGKLIKIGSPPYCQHVEYYCVEVPMVELIRIKTEANKKINGELDTFSISKLPGHLAILFGHKFLDWHQWAINSFLDKNAITFQRVNEVTQEHWNLAEA